MDNLKFWLGKPISSHSEDLKKENKHPAKSIETENSKLTNSSPPNSPLSGTRQIFCKRQTLTIISLQVEKNALLHTLLISGMDILAQRMHISP